jgi:hypothetical protein
MKTTLAPNAPWYDPSDLIWPVKAGKQPYVAPKPIKRTHRAKPADIDKKFEEWLSSIERIKK